MKGKLKYKGGPGSGHHGHSGIPGKVGGSLPSGGSAKPADLNITTSLGTSAARDAKTRKMLNGWADEYLPESVIDRVPRIIVYTSEERFNNAMKLVGLYDKPLEKGQYIAGFNEGHTISLRQVGPMNLQEDWKNAFLHEVGHSVWDKANSDKKQGWENRWAKYPNFDKFTWYSRASYTEGFAEAFAAYCGYPKGSRKASDPKVQEVFDLIEDMIK